MLTRGSYTKGAAVPSIRIGAGGRRPRCASQHALSRPLTMQGGVPAILSLAAMPPHPDLLPASGEMERAAVKIKSRSWQHLLTRTTSTPACAAFRIRRD
jgi:hypothetical protein